MPDPIIEASGTDGTIRVYDTYVEIVDRRLLESLRSGERTHAIPLDDIADVAFRDAGTVRNGVIKVLPSNVDGGDIHSTAESYTVRFVATDQNTFKSIRERIHELR